MSLIASVFALLEPLVVSCVEGPQPNYSGTLAGDFGLALTGVIDGSRLRLVLNLYR